MCHPLILDQFEHSLCFKSPPFPRLIVDIKSQDGFYFPTPLMFDIQDDGERNCAISLGLGKKEKGKLGKGITWGGKVFAKRCRIFCYN